MLVAATHFYALSVAGAGTQAKPLKNYENGSRYTRRTDLARTRGSCRNARNNRKKDPGLIEQQLVVENWWTEFGCKPMTTRDLVAEAQEREPAPPRPADAEPNWQPPRMPRLRPGLYAALMNVAEKGDQLDVRALSIWLGAHEGRVRER